MRLVALLVLAVLAVQVYSVHSRRVAHRSALSSFVSKSKSSARLGAECDTKGADIKKKLIAGTASDAEVTKYIGYLENDLSVVTSDDKYGGGAKSPKVCGFIEIPAGFKLYHGDKKSRINAGSVPHSSGPQHLGDGAYFTSFVGLAKGYAMYTTKKAGGTDAVVVLAENIKKIVCPVIAFHPEYFNKPLTQRLSACEWDCVASEMPNEYQAEGFKIWTLLGKQGQAAVKVTDHKETACKTYTGKLQNVLTLDSQHAYEVVLYRENMYEKKQLVDIPCCVGV